MITGQVLIYICISAQTILTIKFGLFIIHVLKPAGPDKPAIARNRGSKMEHKFKFTCTKVQRAIVVTLTLVLAWAWVSHLKILQQFFLCDWQGTVRQTILYWDRSRLL